MGGGCLLPLASASGHFLLFSSLMSNPKFIELIVGVSASGNAAGDGGYGVILKYREHLKELSCGYANILTTRLELRGILAGILSLKEPCDIAIYSANQLVIDSWQKEWISTWKRKGWLVPGNTKIQHTDLYRLVDYALGKHEFEFFQVSESEHRGLFKRCKELAQAARVGEGLREDMVEGMDGVLGLF